jgi:hypothetical protein
VFKTEKIYRRGPWKGLEDVELATLEWVAWYNGSRLLEPLGYVPPAEFEHAYHDRHAAPVDLAWRFSRHELSGKPGTVQTAPAPYPGSRLRELPWARTHLSLDKDAPHGPPIELPPLGAIIPIPEVGGLHHRYVRRAA